MGTILSNETSAGGTTCMADDRNEFTIDDVARKVGGRFKLTVLVQKRFKELNQWSLETGKKLPRDLIDAILTEIWEGAIELLPEPEEISAEKLLGGD